ncbi:MAG: SsrA-binding protein SmpB [Actinomycetota bacterium]
MTPQKHGDPDEKVVASNRKARHDYQILETLECGIVLTGDEVKSLRGGRASLTEAYARVRDGEVWLEGMHVPPYEQGDKRRHLPTRPRKLLLHRREIEKLGAEQQEQRLALVPLRVYFTHGMAKVEIGVARGKREHEKRQSIAKREQEREIAQELGRRR